MHLYVCMYVCTMYNTCIKYIIFVIAWRFRKALILKSQAIERLKMYNIVYT